VEHLLPEADEPFFRRLAAISPLPPLPRTIKGSCFFTPLGPALVPRSRARNIFFYLLEVIFSGHATAF